MSEPYTWGSAPKLSFTVSDNISRSSPSSTNYSGTLTVTFGACSGGSKFGYTIGVTINGVYKKLKGNLPDQWSSLSASFSVSGDTTASSITIVGTLNTNAPRGDATFTYTTSIGSYSGGSSSGGGTTAGASVPTLSKSSAKLGEGLTIYTNRQSSSYTHTVAYTLGGTTATIATGVTTSTVWTIPTSLIDKVAMSGTSCAITVTTYYYGTNKGSNTVYLTLYPPDGAAPTVESGWVSVSRDNSAIPDVSAWVKGYSKAKITFDPDKVTGNYGATISKFSVLYGGVRTEAVDNEATTGTLADVNAAVFCTVTDSRGNSTTEEIVVPVLDYAPPTITGAEIFRCDSALLPADEGVHIAAKATAGCTSLDGANSVTLTAAYKAVGAADYGAEVALESGVAGMVTGSDDVSTMQSYLVRLTATDRLGVTTTFEKTVPTKAVTFHLKNGGKGAAFGKYAETDELFECQWDASFSGNASFAGQMKIGGKTLAEVITAVVTPMIPKALDINGVYPVGSIYMTLSDDEPETLFPGTYWERLPGRFLLGASAGLYEAGSTGGEAQVTLEQAQMPSHTHTGTTLSDGQHSHSFSGNQSSGSGQTAEGKGASDSHYTFYTSTDGAHTHGFTTNAAGGGAAHNNMPPYLVVNMWKRTS